MPAMRDSTYAQLAAIGTVLTVPMCDYAEGDLLFAFLVQDAGAPTVTCTNGIGTWTQSFLRTNIAMMTVFWKYAAASGEENVVLTSTVSDGICGWMCSVRDVFQGYTAGTPPLQSNVAQASATRFLLPTIAAQADSIILTSFANSSIQPAIMFGQSNNVQQLFMNGLTEGGSMGWFYQPTTATTPASPVGVTVAGAGIAAVIECRAPAGGALVRPAYPASDDSVLMLLNPGVVYDGSTALANTADTAFGTTVGGIAVVDATVVTAIADVGVDPKGFMGSAGLTNVSNATNISGLQALVPVGKYNLGDSNVLGHLRSVTTIASQNMGAIGTTRAVWFGLRSGATNATNYKVWQVHGADAPYYGTGVVPFVVNPANVDTRAALGTVGTTDVRNYGYWMSGSGLMTGQLLLGSLWKMGTTVIAGGTVAEPIGVEGLEVALTKGKIRWSAIRNGANQLLCLQAVQFGDGSAPIYLDLDSTAVEFPSQRNVTKKLINYNGIDDAIGFTYYAGATDTIKHTAAVISSPSKYHWRIHASSSALATYDFSGLSIIGAGDVQLRPVTTFSNMSFALCPTITQNSAVITSCNFSASTIISTDLTKVGTSSFKSAGTGYAVILTSLGAGSFNWTNTATGYAATDGVTGNETIFVNVASGTLTINVASGASIPTIRTAGAVITVVSGQVTTLITVRNIDTGAVLEGARVYLEATAGGPLVAGTAIFNTLTNVSGQVSDTRSLASNQPVVGRVRFSTSPNFYKTAPIAETISNTNGLTLNVSLIPDI